MRYFYYPGCSLKSSGKPYEESLLAVFNKLGVKMQELPEWSCCGATTYMGVDEVQAFALAARNLAIAEKSDDSGPACLVAPCNACYLVLNKAQHYIAEYTDVRHRVTGALSEIGLSYKGDVKVRHPLDVLMNDVGLDAIKKNVTKPLKGMKVACYYGCQIVRPYATFDDQQNPTSMDKILQALGAETIEWPLKTRCCGASLMGTIEAAGQRLSYILLREARRLGADTVATCCPLCQHNLECYQGAIANEYGEGAEAPVAYFTQLMGIAFGIQGHALGLQRLMKPIHLTAATV
jgi:heterodisulfide reductase subunit B2